MPSPNPAQFDTPPGQGNNGRDLSASPALSLDDVRRVATLARLAITDDQARAYQPQLAAVLGYMARLHEIDLTGVEPLSHPTERTAQLDEDRPRTPSTDLPTEALLKMAPETMGPFVKVPKVIGEGEA